MKTFDFNDMNKITFAFLAVLAFALPASAQVAPQVDVMPVDISIELDELGDAAISFEMKMSAKGWAAWKQQYGDNPSLLRRDMGQFVSQYVVDDFDLEQDEMDRTMKMSVAARGVARHRGDGRYEFELEPEMGDGEPDDAARVFRYNYTQSEGPTAVMLMNLKVALPDGAEAATQRTDSAGRPVLAYAVDVDTGGGRTMLLIGGIVLTVVGLGILPAAFMGSKRVPVTEAA